MVYFTFCVDTNQVYQYVTRLLAAIVAVSVKQTNDKGEPRQNIGQRTECLSYGMTRRWSMI